jgi:hypothetical protein
MTTPDLARKVQQLDNDVHEIYGLLNGIAGTQQRHGHRLDELAAKLDTHDTRFDAMDAKLDRVIQLVSGDDASG